MKKTTFLAVLFSLLGFISCKDSNEPNLENSQPQGFVSSENVYNKPKENPTYHEDEETKYEYRTGTSGNYEYNYDVVGQDENGDEVSGNISIQGKSGSGTITNAEGDEVEIDAEWIDYGKLKAIDENGEEYELEAE